jgi:PRC-barrel domain
VSDPVAWTVIERGWEVVDEGGDQVGKVEQVLGDPDRDIFDGLAVSTGLIAKASYVPSEQVGAITVGRVQLELSRAQVESLEAYEPS